MASSIEAPRPRKYPYRMNKREQRLAENLYGNRAVYDGNAFQRDNVASVTYDFAVSGGAVSTITLAMVANSQIPANAVITGVTIDVQTTFTSGGAATGTFKLATDGALTNAIALADLSAGVKIVGQTANFTFIPLKTTVAQDFSFTIAAAAYTAGKARFYVNWVPGN